MSSLKETLDWTCVPVPSALHDLAPLQQQAVVDFTREVVAEKTDGFDELYQAISMIVKYIPNFIVVPLMVDHIKPQIAAGVCRKMGVEQSTHYANDLPLEYFSAVSRHLDHEMMAQILEKMKRHQAEKVIHHELQHDVSHLFEIANHLDKRLLEFVARKAILPERLEELNSHPHHAIIEKIRALQ